MGRLSLKGQTLDDFTYNDAGIAGEIYAAMNATQFLGVSVNFHLLTFYLVAILSAISALLASRSRGLKLIRLPRGELQDGK
jgi:hypothetical protein